MANIISAGCFEDTTTAEEIHNMKKFTHHRRQEILLEWAELGKRHSRKKYSRPPITRE